MAAARAKFFSGLPADELTPYEHALRKALLKAVGSCPGPFPLIEWIDRRVGGEIETRRDENGSFEIFTRGSNPPPVEGGKKGAGNGNDQKEAFFATLSADNFAPAEEALRDAVFEFLATWRSPELATMAQMTAHPEVQRRRAAFLPRNVPLRDWIEHRIGGEIELRSLGGGRPEVVHLTETARTTVMAKFAQMTNMPPMGPCMGPPMMHMGMPPPPMGPPHGHGGGHMGGGGAGGREAPATARDKDAAAQAWFTTLPTDELLPGELALREALLAWIKRWPQLRPSTRAANSPPHLADTGQDAEIRRARADLLPAKVRLADWIERRIGGELELRPALNGQQEVYIRGSAPPEDKSRGGRGVGSGGGTAEEKERFFTSLPDDEFSEAEETLRAALLDFLDRWSGSGPPGLSDAASEEDVGAARRALLPKGAPVSFKEWIDRRIGGEIETKADGPKGQAIFGRRGELGGTGGAKRRRV